MQQVVTGVFWLANVNSTILVVEILEMLLFFCQTCNGNTDVGYYWSITTVDHDDVMDVSPQERH